MNKLKLSSKMHVMIIVSAIIVAVGIAVGLICQFIANGYFNYGDEYSNYNCVEVDYVYVDLKDDGAIKDICDKAFSDAGVSYYASNKGLTEDGGRWTFKFGTSQSASKVSQAADKITEELQFGKNTVGLSRAQFHSDISLKGNTPSYVYGAIAAASVIAFQFLYFAIRYKLSSAFAALLANVHNLALYISIVAATRIPVGNAVVAFGAVTVLATMIACSWFFDRVRQNSKSEEYAKLGAEELSDECLAQSFTPMCVSSAGIVAIAVLLFVVLSISALSAAVTVAPFALALVSAAVSLYGSAFFIPSVYPGFRKIGDNFKEKRKLSKKS